jgi:hypothetical protein
VSYYIFVISSSVKLPTVLLCSMQCMYDLDFHMLVLVGGGEGDGECRQRYWDFPDHKQIDARVHCTVLYTFILRMFLLVVNINIQISIENLGYVGQHAAQNPDHLFL